jgi:hypothetical protein
MLDQLWDWLQELARSGWDASEYYRHSRGGERGRAASSG